MKTSQALAAEIAAATTSFLNAWQESPKSGLTPPDPHTKERWTPAQILGHVAEMLEYWYPEIQRILTGPTGIPFGRTKATPSRIARIDDYATHTTRNLIQDIRAFSERWNSLLIKTDSQELLHTGTHPTLGTMTAQKAIEEFVTDHLKEHALQLEELYGKDN